jgi:hypothetical protein
MAETVYKKISELDTATLPLAGTEYLEVSQTGASKKALLSGWFGAGWWAKLAAAFTAFVAPDSLHADNADTLGTGEEEPVDFHDATQLVGAVPLGSIPAELTGKNADTVDSAHVGVGIGKLQPYRGYIHGTYTVAQIYAILDSVLPSVNDEIPINGGVILSGGNDILSRAKRTSSSLISFFVLSHTGSISNWNFNSTTSTSFICSFTY